MINNNDNPVEWALLLLELEDASEHLRDLIDQMVKAGEVSEEEFAIGIGHVYAHMNRVWHSRDIEGDVEDDKRTELSRFPVDLEPVGQV